MCMCVLCESVCAHVHACVCASVCMCVHVEKVLFDGASGFDVLSLEMTIARAAAM